MPDLLLLEDASHLDHVLSQDPGLLDRLRPVTSDLVVADRLEKLGVPFVEPLTLIDCDEAARIRARVHDLIARWWGAAGAAVEYRGSCLLTAAAQELRDPFETCLTARAVSDRLLDICRPRTLHGFFLRATPMRRSGPAPLNRASLGLAHAVLRGAAARRGVVVRHLRDPGALSVEQRDGAPAGAVRPATPPGVPRVWLTPEVPGHVAWDGRLPDVARLRSGRRLALLLENVQNPRELEQLERALGERPDWAAVRLIASDHSTLHSRPWHLRALYRRLRRARTAFEAWCDAYAGENAEVFTTPAMRRQFRSIWTDLRRAVGLGESFAHALTLLRPDISLFAFASFTLERVMVRVARQAGVPAVGLLHGGLNPAHDPMMLAGDESDLLVWGDADVQFLSQISSGRRLHVVGSPRYHRQYREWNPDRPDAQRRRATREALGLRPDAPVVVLITAAINSGMCLMNADPARHRAAWRDLLALVRRRPDLTFVLKPHPSFDSFAFYRHIASDAPPNLRLSWDEYLTAVLPAADVAVLVSCCTTGSLEAMLAGLPVVFLQTAAYRTALHRDSLGDHGAVRVESAAALEAAVDRLLGDAEFRRQTVARAGVLLRSVLDDPLRPAPERIIERLSAIAEEAAPAPAGTDGGDDPAALYARAVGVLAAGNGDDFLAAWGRCVGALAGAPVGRVREYLFRLSVDLGRAVPEAGDLLRLAARCQDAAQGLPLGSADRDGFLVNALLTSLTWHGMEGPRSERLATELIRREPRALLRLPGGKDFLGRLVRSGEDAAAASALVARLRNAEQQLAALHRSWTWRLGRLLVGPVARLRRLLGRRRSA